MTVTNRRSRLVSVLCVAPLSLAAQTVQTLDIGGDVGKHTSIAVDGTHNPHISYFDETNKNLRTSWRSDIWHTTTVDGGADVGEYTSIAVFPAPILTFISYYDAGDEHLRLAHQTTAGGPYAIEELPTSVRLAARSSVVLNSMSTTPIIAFFDVNDHNLKLALFDRGGVFTSPPLSFPQWGVEIVAPATNVEDLAFVLDAGNEPHLAYIEQDGITAVLKYAYKDCAAAGCLTQITPAQQAGQGSWNIEEVPGTGLVGASVALALDPTTDDPLIAYYSAGQLKYAVKSGGAWSIEPVPDLAGDVGRHVSIALATTGDPNLIYYDAINGDLKRAVKSGGSWTVSTIDARDDIGQYTDVAIDINDGLHISYYGVTNTDLRYASVRSWRGRWCISFWGLTFCMSWAITIVVVTVVAGAWFFWYWRRRKATE